MNLSNVLNALDLIDRAEGIFSTFKNGNWRKSFARRGMAGVAQEFFSCLTRYNSPVIHVSRESAMTGNQIERMLKAHGVKLWNRGVCNNSTEIYFCVKRRQVRWAKYLLIKHGVSIV